MSTKSNNKYQINKLTNLIVVIINALPKFKKVSPDRSIIIVKEL